MNATLSALSGAAQVPVIVSAATLDGNGNVVIAGTKALGAGANLTLNENTLAANAAVTLLGSTVTSNVGVTVVCFCSGTRIRTTAGDVAVEDLAIGETVITASGL